MLDLYKEITDRIIAELEKGNIPWEKPWAGTADGAIKRSNGKPYSLINQFLLGGSGEYITFDQCKKEGGHVKKGAKSKFVVFWKTLRKDKVNADGSKVIDSNGNIVYTTIPVLRYYNVFSINDCEGIKPKWNKETMPKCVTPVEDVEVIIDDYAHRVNLHIEHEKQNRAYYRPLDHMVMLPLAEQFYQVSEYYGTAFHELVHSTGHKTLLNRFTDDKAARFGSEVYSKEELVAEIGSCAILNKLGMETESSFRNNAAYIQSWLRALKDDKHMIVSAAGKAEKAMKLILNIKDDESEVGIDA